MDNKQINEEFWNDFNSTVEKILVPKFSSETVRPCAEEDFQDHRKDLKENLNYFNSLLDVIVQNEKQWTTKDKRNLIKIIIIIGEQHCKCAWNTHEIVEISKLLIPKICKIFKCENISELLKNDDIFLSIVKFLRPQLLKDTWKSNPASVICYTWILKSVEKPLLKVHVPEVLPTALIIFDDYVEENQALGLECINKIIEHCQQSRSLKNLNYDEVIYEALKKMARKVDSKLIIPLYSCISSLLDIIQYCDENQRAFNWTKRDDILCILLDNMELQTNPEYRNSYVISLIKLMIHSSIGKWSQRITRILSEYCEDSTDFKILTAALNLLKTFISLYQPQELNFYTSLYSALLKVRHKLHTSAKDTKNLIEEVDSCLNLLDKQCPKLSEEIMKNDIIQSIRKM